MAIDTFGLRRRVIRDWRQLADRPAAAADPDCNLIELSPELVTAIGGTAPDRPTLNAPWPDLTVRPRFVQWIADSRAGSDGLIVRQSARERRHSRLALRYAAQLRCQVHERLTTALLQEWLELYQSNRVQHRRELGLAEFYVKAVDLSRNNDMLISWRDGSRLVGGCLVHVDTTVSALRGRFSAVSADGRPRDLSRAMYLVTAEVAQRYRLDLVTLGCDPNLYGPALPTGLLPFKRRIGFIPVPQQLIDPARGQDSTELMVSLAGLGGPVFRLLYPSSGCPEDSRTDPHAAGTLSNYLSGATRLQLAIDCAERDADSCRELRPDRLTLHPDPCPDEALVASSLLG